VLQKTELKRKRRTLKTSRNILEKNTSIHGRRPKNLAAHDRKGERPKQEKKFQGGNQTEALREKRTVPERKRGSRGKNHLCLLHLFEEIEGRSICQRKNIASERGGGEDARRKQDAGYVVWS